MASQLQIEANRRNAKLATGPRTEAGKCASKANSYQHGFTGKGVVLADDLAEAVAARAAFWVGEIGAVTEEEKGLAGQIALEQVRIDRCQRQEASLAHDQAFRAVYGWDLDQARVASEIARGIRKQPESVALALEGTTQGCALKVKRWKGLLRFLRNGKAWDETRSSVALDLLGVIPELRDPEANPFGETAEEQAECARDEIARLEGLQAEWLDTLSERRREQAAAGYAFPDHGIWLVRRYEAACTRRLNGHLKKLVGRPEADCHARPDAVAPAVVTEHPVDPDRTHG